MREKAITSKIYLRILLVFHWASPLALLLFSFALLYKNELVNLNWILYYETKHSLIILLIILTVSGIVEGTLIYSKGLKKIKKNENFESRLKIYRRMLITGKSIMFDVPSLISIMIFSETFSLFYLIVPIISLFMSLFPPSKRNIIRTVCINDNEKKMINNNDVLYTCKIQ